MLRLLTLLLVGLLLVGSPSYATPAPDITASYPDYQVLAVTERQATVGQVDGLWAEVTIYAPPDTTAAGLQRVAEAVLDRLVARHLNVLYVTIYMVDTLLPIPYAYNTAVAYWRPQEWAHATSPVRHGLILDFYPRQKVTKPGSLPRPSDDEIRCTSLMWRLWWGAELEAEDWTFLVAFAQDRTAEELWEIINRVHIWLNY